LERLLRAGPDTEPDMAPDEPSARAPRLRHIVDGGAPCPPALPPRLRAAFPRARPQGTKEIYVGRGAELRVFHRIPDHGVEQVMKQADVIFDQIVGFGVYGTISAEAMSYGKPVLATIDHALYPPDCPVIYPSPMVLKELACDEVLRRSIGAKGRAHAEREFDAKAVARRVLDAYDRGGP
jgi:hypothetical protein